MNNTDGLPGPEARVREFLEALDQENARSPELPAQDDLAWCVPDEGGLRTLTASDIRDVLREFDAERAALAETRRGRDLPLEEDPERAAQIVRDDARRRMFRDATDPHATPDQVHARDIRDMTTEALQARYAELVEFHDGRASLDPRCGCSADNEGGSCYWDSTDEIDEELGRRGR